MNRKTMIAGLGFAFFLVSLWLYRSHRANAVNSMSRASGTPLERRLSQEETAPTPQVARTAEAGTPDDVGRPSPASAASTKQQADAIRALMERRLGEPVKADNAPSEGRAPVKAPSQPNEPAADIMPAPAGSGNQANEAMGHYVRDTIKKNFYPMGGSCYGDLLSKRQDARGKIIFDVTIVGDKSVGGVVDDVHVDSESTLTDASFVECMRESMYAMVFPAPPAGQQKVTFKLPLDLAPEPPTDEVKTQ